MDQPKDAREQEQRELAAKKLKYMTEKAIEKLGADELNELSAWMEEFFFGRGDQKKPQ